MNDFQQMFREMMKRKMAEEKARGMQLVDIPKELHFKPYGLCQSVHINVSIFDQAMINGYRLNLITGKYYK